LPIHFFANDLRINAKKCLNYLVKNKLLLVFQTLKQSLILSLELKILPKKWEIIRNTNS
jgi:hypothetical protein